MSTCTCGGVSIECPAGCGCFHISGSGTEYVRWCEPATVHLAAFADDSFTGGIVRITTGADGMSRMAINGNALKSSPNMPRYALNTRFEACLDGASVESIALIVGILLGQQVAAPQDRKHELVNDRLDDSLGEIMRRFDLALI